MTGWPEQPVIYEINTAVWLDELSQTAGRRVTLADVAARDWDAATPAGADAVWLMGVWERSPAGLVLAATLFGHESAAFGVQGSAGLCDADARLCLGSCAVSVMPGAEQSGERVDGLEQQRVDAGLLVGGVTGLVFGDGAAVLGLGCELTHPGRGGRGHVGHWAAGRGVVSLG